MCMNTEYQVYCWLSKMTTEEKSIQIIECSGKMEDWEGWSKRFLARGRWKGYHMFLTCADQKEGGDKVPMSKEYDQAVGTITANSKKVREL